MEFIKHSINKKSPPVFVSIETTAFSGATLLALLLNQHPMIATIGEISGLIRPDYVNSYKCSCGKRILDCDFWENVRIQMQDRGYNFNLKSFNTKFYPTGDGGKTRNLLYKLRTGSLRSPYLDNLRDYFLFRSPWEKKNIIPILNRNIALVEIVLGITGCKVFLDSSKERMLIKVMKEFSGMDVKAAHLVRRVEGVVSSQVRRGRESSVAKLAEGWKRRHKRLLSTFKFWPSSNYFMVRYEDMCNSTNETISTIGDYLGLNKVDLDFEKSNKQHHIIGNSMRLQTLKEIREDLRWKSELSRVELKEIYNIAGKLNEHFGYDNCL